MHGGSWNGTDVDSIFLGANPKNRRSLPFKTSQNSIGLHLSIAFVFVDESEYTIDDGYFAVLVQRRLPGKISQPIATAAPPACPLPMAIAKLKRWVEPSTAQSENSHRLLPGAQVGDHKRKSRPAVCCRIGTFNPPETLTEQGGLGNPK
jgi:hypothetical protein